VLHWLIPSHQTHSTGTQLNQSRKRGVLGGLQCQHRTLVRNWPSSSLLDFSLALTGRSGLSLHHRFPARQCHRITRSSPLLLCEFGRLGAVRWDRKKPNRRSLSNSPFHFLHCGHKKFTVFPVRCVDRHTGTSAPVAALALGPKKRRPTDSFTPATALRNRTKNLPPILSQQGTGTGLNSSPSSCIKKSQKVGATTSSYSTCRGALFAAATLQPPGFTTSPNSQVVADKSRQAHTLVSQSPVLGRGARVETPTPEISLRSSTTTP